MVTSRPRKVVTRKTKPLMKRRSVTSNSTSKSTAKSEIGMKASLKSVKRSDSSKSDKSDKSKKSKKSSKKSKKSKKADKSVQISKIVEQVKKAKFTFDKKHELACDAATKAKAVWVEANTNMTEKADMAQTAAAAKNQAETALNNFLKEVVEGEKLLKKMISELSTEYRTFCQTKTELECEFFKTKKEQDETACLMYKVYDECADWGTVEHISAKAKHAEKKLEEIRKNIAHLDENIAEKQTQLENAERAYALIEALRAENVGSRDLVELPISGCDGSIFLDVLPGIDQNTQNKFLCIKDNFMKMARYQKHKSRQQESQYRIYEKQINEAKEKLEILQRIDAERKIQTVKEELERKQERLDHINKHESEIADCERNTKALQNKLPSVQTKAPIYVEGDTKLENLSGAIVRTLDQIREDIARESGELKATVDGQKGLIATYNNIIKSSGDKSTNVQTIMGYEGQIRNEIQNTNEILTQNRRQVISVVKKRSEEIDDLNKNHEKFLAQEMDEKSYEKDFQKSQDLVANKETESVEAKEQSESLKTTGKELETEKISTKETLEKHKNERMEEEKLYRHVANKSNEICTEIKKSKRMFDSATKEKMLLQSQYKAIEENNFKMSKEVSAVKETVRIRETTDVEEMENLYEEIQKSEEASEMIKQHICKLMKEISKYKKICYK